MPSKKSKSKPPKRWDIYPSFHASVSTLLSDSDLTFAFHPIDSPTCVRDYDTNIMGRFICHNPSCSNSGWSSKKIAITIRLYEGEKYNARVYFQRCRQCNSLSKPFLDGSYAERVAYRIKKWCGVQMVELPWQGKKSRGPHDAKHCEGCKDGHCAE